MEKPKKRSASLSELMKRKEVKILVVGLVMVVLYCQFLVVTLFFNPDVATGLATMSMAHFFGRAAGLTHGYYVLNYPSWVVISVNALLETMAVLVVYPTFVLAMEKVVVWKAVQDKMMDIRDSAEKNKGRVRRYGLIGLFLFVLFPFWMTGPIIGCIIGYLLHIRLWVNLSVVLSGTYVAILAWATVFKSVQERVQVYGKWAPVGIVGMVIIFSLGMHFYHRKNTRARDGASASSDATDGNDEDVDDR